MSRWYALQVLGESWLKTRELLFRPVSLWFWLKLAFVVMIVGGGLGSGLNFNYNLGDSDFESLSGILASHLPFVVALILFFVFLLIVFSFIGSVFEFIFLRSLIQDAGRQEIRIIQWFMENVDRGFSLFLFDLVLLVAAIVFVAVLVVPFFFFELSMENLGTSLLFIAYAFIGLSVLLAGLIIFSVIDLFTKDFVVPLMYTRKSGVLKEWKNLIPTVRREYRQILAYILVKIALMVVAIIMSVIVVLALILFFAVFVVLLGLLGMAFMSMSGASLIDIIHYGLAHPVVIVLGALAFTAFVFLFSYLTVCLTLPIPVFFRYYSILFLQKLVSGLSLVSTEPANNGGEEKKSGKEEASVCEDERPGGGDVRLY